MSYYDTRYSVCLFVKKQPYSLLTFAMANECLQTEIVQMPPRLLVNIPPNVIFVFVLTVKGVGCGAEQSIIDGIVADHQRPS